MKRCVWCSLLTVVSHTFEFVCQILKEENFPHDMARLRNHNHEGTDIESAATQNHTTNHDESDMDTLSDIGDHEMMIEIPKPGRFPLEEARPEMRLATGACSICISSYQVGSDVVWSSNPACEHVFHAQCIEEWLIKQREGSQCPCCRQEFIIDPLDETHSNVGEDMVLELVPLEEEGTMEETGSDPLQSSVDNEQEPPPRSEPLSPVHHLVDL